MWIKWFKLDEKAIIPTKEPEAAGFDIYTIEKDFVLEPHSQHAFATGLAFACEEGWWLKVEDRGSNGSKGAHVHCGVLDVDYRGEIFICLNNDNNYPIKFSSTEPAGFHTHKEKHQAFIKNSLVYRLEEVDVVDYLVYPSSKAIAQIVPILQPQVESSEMTAEEWESFKNTKRGAGKLGSSGK